MQRIAVLVALTVFLAPVVALAQSVGIFVVYGKVTTSAGDRVQVENEMVVASQQSALLSDFTTGTYAVVFAEFETNRAAALGDRFRVTLLDVGNNEIDVKSIVVTQAHLNAFGAHLNIGETTSVASKTWTAIRALYR